MQKNRIKFISIFLSFITIIFCGFGLQVYASDFEPEFFMKPPAQPD